MKVRSKLFTILVLLTTITLLAAAQTDPARVMMEAAKKKEVVDGDINGAIQEYKAIVAKFPKQRAVVADAMIRMAEGYEKLGDFVSKKIYEQVLRDYADQKDAAAVARARLGGNAPVSNAGMITRQVWAEPPADILGTISRDGRYLSFVDWETGDLALRDMSTGKNRRLTNKGSWLESADFALESVISPDGKQAAYHWFNNKDLKFDLRLISLNTSGPAIPRVLYDNEDIERIHPSDWSPDGKWIGVQVVRKDGTTQIALVNTTDGSLRVLKSMAWNETKVFFSPDSKYLAFNFPSGEDSKESDVFVLATDASREIPVVVHPANDSVMGWMPDGKHLLFASDRSGSMGIWALPFYDGRTQGNPELLKPDVGRALPMGMSRSGALYFGVILGGPDVYTATIDFNSGKVLTPAVGLIQRFVRSSRWPEWSPDGKHLAYVSKREPGGIHFNILSIRSMETDKVKELAPKLIYLNGLRWAPDGRSFITQGTDFKGREGIHRIDAINGNTDLIADGSSPEWTPDGTGILYVRLDSEAKEQVIIARDLVSGREREVRREKDLSLMSLSPDGRYLTYTTQGALVALPIGGGEPRELLRLQRPQSFVQFTAWSPDSRSIIFRKNLPPAEPEILMIPVTGGEPRKIDLNVSNVRGLRIQRESGQIAFHSPSGRPPEVWVMENFLPAGAKK